MQSGFTVAAEKWEGSPCEKIIKHLAPPNSYREEIPDKTPMDVV